MEVNEGDKTLPATQDEVARVRRAYERVSAPMPDDLLAQMEKADQIPDAKPLRKLAKVWDAMRPADRAAVGLELARLVGFQVEVDELDVGLAARAAAENVDPDGRKVKREPGFEHAVTVAARIWVERGNPYAKGNTYYISNDDTKHQAPYPMQVFVADLVERALPPIALARRNATPNASATTKDVLRMVDTSLREHDQKLRESRKVLHKAKKS
ncbi:MAG: hypothetical protein CO108_26170 [Deltaproteobacteria bacterium CG_4_9_14_3_um_filter_63_12]|nr:MAG: hypothetical protein CO108_26170 [Deltaproteobacteria bacterium CG_4_9_14_3_um_filter_63_12]